jgi:DNA modification methylase
VDKIINQAHGKNWSFYHGDCVFVSRNLPDDSIDFTVYSPPFLSLYIYSDSIADLGNTDSESQFLDGYKFHLEEQYRTLKPGRHIAIHCKDTMRYMSTHGYAGLYDFPGQIIRLAESVGFNFERWITIWKDPVVEMQRTKTYGLLHKSFQERGEVTRQGCADFVLIFNKEGNKPIEELPSVNADVVERCVHQWTQPGERILTPLDKDIRDTTCVGSPKHYSFWSKPNEYYEPSAIEVIQDNTIPGRNTTIHCTAQMMRDIIERFESVDGWKFHSRVAVTDGSYLVTFRKWSGQFENKVVKHFIKPPTVEQWQTFSIVKRQTELIDGEVVEMGEETETWREPVLKGNEKHTDYIGTQPPINWKDGTYYSILLWQRYASPVWFDLEGLPNTHPDSWMDIIQTNVLNYREARGDEEEKHICPLQLDLIEKLILEYTKRGEVIVSPYGGVGSEPYVALKFGRKAIASELKEQYWKIGCKNLVKADFENTQGMLQI